MASSPPIRVRNSNRRAGFAIIYDELWTDYLPHIGGPGALLYCFLKAQTCNDIPNPCSEEWGSVVCRPLGLTVQQSHQGWALLQEMGLITYEDDAYILNDPQVRTPTDRASDSDAPDSLFAAVEDMFGRPLNGAEVYQLETLGEEYAEDLIVAAARFAVLSSAFSLPYMKQILLNWKAKGILTVKQAEEDHREHSLRKAKKHARSGESRGKQGPAVKQSDAVNYDDEEIILKRMLKAAKGEGARHG